MTTEAGAKCGIIEPDAKTLAYLERRGAGGMRPVRGDPGAPCARELEYDASGLEPLVAEPYSPGNVRPVREASREDLDKAYIGSCTGAKYEDLAAAASVLRGRRVRIRTEVLPAAISIYRRAMEDGILKVFLDAGATVGPPTCGACCGAHMGVLGDGEACVSTTNRNFPGRMGHRGSRTFLASPLVAAASAVTGRLTDPRDLP